MLELKLQHIIPFITVLILLIVVLWSLTQLSYGLYYGHDKTVGGAVQNSSFLSQQISVTEKGAVYVVWVDKNNIYFSATYDGGNKFTHAVLLSDSNKSSSSPHIAANEKGDVYVVWVDIDNKTGDSNIIFRSSNNTGKTFSPQKELRGGESISFFPQLAATEKGDVYVVWVDINNKTADSNIEFISSNDSGKTFSPRKEIRGGSALSFFPQITATEKGNVYVVWVDIHNATGDSNIEFISSNDSGKTFSPRKEIRGGSALSFSPQITATEKGDVYVVWVDKNIKTGDSDINFRSSNVSGKNFDERKKLRSNNLLSFSPQLIATEKGDVYSVWTDKNSTTGKRYITFTSSNDRGLDFKRAVKLNADEDKILNSSSPHITTTQNGSVYVVWLENQVKFKEILDKDDIFGSPISLSNKTISSLSPEITATKNGNLFVIWIDKSSTTDRSLHFKRISENFFDRNH
jgi:hypothetical protein